MEISITQPPHPIDSSQGSAQSQSSAHSLNLARSSQSASASLSRGSKPAGSSQGSAQSLSLSSKPAGSSQGSAQSLSLSSKPAGSSQGSAQSASLSSKRTGSSQGSAQSASLSSKPAGSSQGSAQSASLSSKPAGSSQGSAQSLSLSSKPPGSTQGSAQSASLGTKPTEGSKRGGVQEARVSGRGATGCLSSGGALPNYHQRAFAHNYRAPFIYHIILKKEKGCKRFGEVRGDSRIAPGKAGSAYIAESTLGRIIAKEILNLPRQFHLLKIYQFIVMPDHVHILLRVMQWSDYHLDHYINCLLTNIATTFSVEIGKKIEWPSIFMIGYCDKPLLLKRSLDGLFRYIRENPHRLAMRQQNPQFFQRVRKLYLSNPLNNPSAPISTHSNPIPNSETSATAIAQSEYEAYGNLFLFRNPDKEAVKISRRFSEEECEAKRKNWLAGTAKGTILVSPFISKKEKALRAEAEDIGGKIILIVHEAFPELYKPAGHDFELCCEGRLLIVSLGMPAKTPISRAICRRMNSLANYIASDFPQ